MDARFVAKEVGKFAVSVGTSMIIGGLGGIAAAAYPVGIKCLLAKVCIPLAGSVWSTRLKKESDPIVEETVDSIANGFAIVQDIGKSVVEKVTE